MSTRSTKPNPFVGRWRIVEMEMWAQDYVDLEGPGHITFERGRRGSFQFGAVRAYVDSRTVKSSEGLRIEFSFAGDNDMDPTCGRGWATVVGDELHGRLFFHVGDESSFRATRGPRSNFSSSGRVASSAGRRRST
jgi:hypothetical protein